MLDGESMLQEFESEFEGEFENEYEFEGEGEYESEEFLGGILKGVGSMLGLGEGEGEYEYEGEYEGEEFLGGLGKRLRGLASKLKPIAQRVAPIAARAVGTAISGNPKIGQTLGNLATQIVREGEFESGVANEFEGEFEYEAMPQPEALAEALATMASQVQSEAEAEAYTGAMIARIIPIKSASMRQTYPRLVKGTAALTRTLRSSPTTRPLVKTLPTIAMKTRKTLEQHAAQGKPITPNTAAKVMAAHTAKVIGNPTECAKAMMRSSRSAQKVAKPMPARM